MARAYVGVGTMGRLGCVWVDSLWVGGRLLAVMGSSQGWAHGARRVVLAIVLAAGVALVVVPGAALAATVSVWHMDELSGTTMIDSAGTNNGTIQNVGLGVPGWSGSAYRFNGQSSIVTVPSSSSLNPGAANFSFTAKISYTATPPNSSTTGYDVLRKGTASDSAQFYKLEIRPDNRAVCRFVGSNLLQRTFDPHRPHAQRRPLALHHLHQNCDHHPTDDRRKDLHEDRHRWISHQHRQPQPRRQTRERPSPTITTAASTKSASLSDNRHTRDAGSQVPRRPHPRERRG